ncbi:MAG: ABC transporter ATP-binding protein [Acidimicrobiales bacterium]
MESLAEGRAPGGGGGAAGAGARSVRVAGVDKAFAATPVLRAVTLQVAAGSVLALLGPSGCGKTTLLRIVAGLEVPDAGEVLVGDEELTGPAGVVAPERRRVGMVFQDWALFPHLTVAQNVGYGLPRPDRGSRSPRVAQALELVGLGGLADRLPSTLSGGQQQRVALARALAPRPAVLLLDEPFSNLDAALRVQVRAEVHRLVVELRLTTVFVTHDQEEAFVLGDEVAVMHEGAIVQQAEPATLYARPATPWVATFVGDANLVEATADGHTAATPVGPIALDAPRTGRVRLVLRPEDLVLTPAHAADAALPGAPGSVELTEYHGHDTVYLVRPGDGGTIRVRAGAAPRFRRGDQVTVRYAGAPAIAYTDGPGAVHEAG